MPNKSPVASQVQVTGNSQVGQTLTGSYVYSDADSDPEGVSTFQWYRADDATGTNKVAISGATSKIYIITDADVGKFIGFAVKPIATKGTLSGIHAISTFVGAVTALNVLPVIESVTPLQSQWGKNTVFTVRGKNLTKGMGFTVGDCEHSNYELPSGTSTKRQFVCTQYGETGIKRGLVKTKRGGQELFTFNVQSDVVIRPRLYINSNTNQLSKNNTALEMYVSADLEGTNNLSTLYDLYLVITLPTGQLVYQSFQEGLSFEPKPFLANMAIPILDDWYQVLSYNFSEALPKGNYRFHFFALKAGENISNVKSSSQVAASNSVMVNYDPNEILPTTTVRRSLEDVQNFSPRRYASGNDVIGLASKLVRKYGLFNRERDVNRNKDSLMDAFNYYTDNLSYDDSLDDRQRDLWFAAKALEMLYNNRSPWTTKNLANGVKAVFEAYNNHYSELAEYGDFTITLGFEHAGFYGYLESTRDISVTVTPLIYYDFAKAYTTSSSYKPTLDEVAIYPYEPKGASFNSISFDVRSTGEKTFNIPMKGLYLVEIVDNSTNILHHVTLFLKKAGETRHISVDY